MKFKKTTGSREQSDSFTLVRSTINDLPKAKVFQVLDGDTVLVTLDKKRITIRLSAIDCPEDGQAWGSNAKSGLIRLIAGQYVHLEIYGSDTYGRTLATMYVNDGSGFINVNEKMVMHGHAWVMRLCFKYISKDRQIKLNKLENWAKTNKVGLWKRENPIAPWKWRKSG